MARSASPRDLPDDGCPDLGIPACLSCPLARCRYEMEEGSGELREAMRAAGLTRPRRTFPPPSGLFASADRLDMVAVTRALPAPRIAHPKKPSGGKENLCSPAVYALPGTTATCPRCGARARATATGLLSHHIDPNTSTKGTNGNADGEHE